jgi:hypothetical protein
MSKLGMLGGEQTADQWKTSTDTAPPQAGQHLVHTRRVTVPYRRRDRLGGGMAWTRSDPRRCAATTTRQAG